MKNFNLKSLRATLKALAPRKVITYSLVLTLLAAGFFVVKNNSFKADVPSVPAMIASSFYTWPTDSSFTTFAKIDGTQTDGKTISLAEDSTGGVSTSTKSVILRPASDAFNPEGNAVASAGKDLFAMVNDDSDATYVSPSGTAANVMFGHGAHGIPAGSIISGVKIFARLSGINLAYGAYGANLLGIYRDNHVDFGGIGDASISNAGDWSVLSQNFPVCPFDANNPWTFADLDAMAFGGVFGNTTSGAKLSQIYAEVSYSDGVKYKTTGTATLENFTFKEGTVHIKNAVIDKTENGGTIKIEYSSDNFSWYEDAKDLRSVSQLFIRVTLTTPDTAKTPVLNKISLEYVPVSAPAKPVLVSPLSGASVVNSKPELKASVFTQPDGATFASSEWEIATSQTPTSTGKFKSPVPGIASTHDASTSYTANMSLTPDKKYFWHVRYKDSYGFASDWSDTGSFTVKQLEKPVNVSPRDQTVGYQDPVSTKPILKADFMGNVPTGTNWRLQLAKDNLASPIIYPGTASITFKVTTPLAIDETYGWSVQYWIGTTSNVSPWSDITFFQTTSNTLEIPTNISPGNNAKGISLLPTLEADFYGEIPDSVTWTIEGYNDNQYISYANTFTIKGSSNKFTIPENKKLLLNTDYDWSVYYNKVDNDSNSYTSGESISTTFRTRDTLLAVKTNLGVGGITPTSAYLTGTITNMDDEITLTKKGFTLCSLDDPCRNIEDNKNLVKGQFSLLADQLKPDTDYSIYAYAGNSNVLVRGQDYEFKTPPAYAAPTITTLVPTNITSKTVVPHGNITDTGRYPITYRGFQYSKVNTGSALVSIYDSGKFSAGEYTKLPIISNLTPNTTYYVRAFAINAKGTTYGGWVQFKTLALIAPPTTTAQGLVMSGDKVVAGATVEVVQDGTPNGLSTTFYSDQNGVYRISGLPAGGYYITVTAPVCTKYLIWTFCSNMQKTNYFTLTAGTNTVIPTFNF